MNDFIPFIQLQTETWATQLWTASLIGAVVFSLAWLLASRFRLFSARVNCWIWRLACAKVLVALFWTQGVALPLLGAAPEGDVCLSPVAAAEPVSLVPVQRLQRPLAISQPIVPARKTSEAVNHRIHWLMLFWVSGVALSVGLTARQWVIVRRLRRSSAPILDEQLLNIYRLAAAELKFRRAPDLRTSSLVRSPLLTGIWRPVILLPDAGGVHFVESEQRLMLMHELTHQLRRDLAWNWLPTIVGWLFFFHPLVWVMRRAWIESQEAACDEFLLQRQITQPAEYGRLLVKVAAQWPQIQPLGMGVVGVQGVYRNLERRIMVMSYVTPVSRRRLQWTACVLLLSGALGIVPWKFVARASADQNALCNAPVSDPAHLHSH
jgi:bla regulator protein BlaR1